MLLIFGDDTFNNVKTKREDVYYIDRVNEGSNIYFSLQDFLAKNKLDSEDTVISFTENSPLEFRLSFPLIPKEVLVITTKNYSIDDVLEDKNLRKKDYDIFSGKKIETKDTQLILSNISLMSYISYQMMEAGYIDLENNKKIDDWIVLFQEPLLQLFVNYTQIETSNPTFTAEDEFLDNPIFRKTILLGMLRVLSNFIINNNYITIEEVSEIGTWTNYDTWKNLKEKIKILTR